MIEKLSNEAPIILTWVPRVHGASLPDGKNSTLNYLDVIKNHKLKNKEERDIYLVINGPGFEQNQMDRLKHELERIEGVYVVDLHQYDWSEIDKGWKLDGKDISVKDFFNKMYEMQEEQRMYFAIEIDTFRLIALSLLKQFTKQEAAIYIDFDSLGAIDDHVGKDITIPEKILLGCVEVFQDDSGKIAHTFLNNDLIAISDSSVAVDILPGYKDKILSQKEMCSEIKRRLPLLMDELLHEEFAKLRGKKETTENQIKTAEENIRSAKADVSRCVRNLENRGISVLYDEDTFQYLNSSDIGFNLGHVATRKAVQEGLIGEEANKWELFAFGQNNGNYAISPVNSDLSWTKGKDLYHIDNELEETEVHQMAMEKLSLK